MNILKLRIFDFPKCKLATLTFNNANTVKTPVYFVQSKQNCEIFTLAIQLMCSCKYDTLQKINEIWPEVRNGQIDIEFVLTHRHTNVDAPVVDGGENSSDDDAPCTSNQAAKRAEERRRRAAARAKERRRAQVSTYKVKACRRFLAEPLNVEFSVNNGPMLSCSIFKFNRKFFTCTDIIFPRMSSLPDGDCCHGRWLDLLATDFIYKGKGGENSLLIKFCELYSTPKVTVPKLLCKYTTAVLIGRYSLDQHRISHLVRMFQHIRVLFEYLTFSEYTVWFLLPQLYGDLQDIADIKTNSINFDLMKTLIQVKTPEEGGISSPKYPWTDAVGYVRELFLICVQLVFGFNCGQNIIYLHNMHELQKHQSFEYIRNVFAYNAGATAEWSAKNYLQRVIDACIKSNVTCVVEYIGGIPFKPKNCFFIQTTWDNLQSNWSILNADTNNTETQQH